MYSHCVVLIIGMYIHDGHCQPSCIFNLFMSFMIMLYGHAPCVQPVFDPLIWTCDSPCECIHIIMGASVHTMGVPYALE